MDDCPSDRCHWSDDACGYHTCASYTCTDDALWNKGQYKYCDGPCDDDQCCVEVYDSYKIGDVGAGACPKYTTMVETEFA